MKKTVLTHFDIDQRARLIAYQLEARREVDYDKREPLYVYPIPRGGIPAAYALQRHVGWIIIVDDPAAATVFVDDVIDSGVTAQRYKEEHGKETIALYDKTTAPDCELGWIEFPWEVNEQEGIADNIRRIIQWMGEDPKREGLLDTPERVARAWRHWCSGYSCTEDQIPTLLKAFADGGEQYDEMVLERNLPFYSHCEHHLAPFFGVAHIAYIPNGRIVGLSKLPRLLEVYSRRLQVQERLTQQVADALFKHLKPRGVGVMIEARHLCMESRGVERQGHQTITTALRGVFKNDAAARNEFLKSVG